MNPPVKRRGENLESSRLKSPPTQSGEFNLNNSEISNSYFNESPSTNPMPHLSTDLTAQARSSAVRSPTKTLDEEFLSDDSDIIEAKQKELDARVANKNARKQKEAEVKELARRRMPSTEDPAWMREAKADLGEHYFQIFCIQAEIIARRTGR
jgi:hypothetical protein